METASILLSEFNLLNWSEDNDCLENSIRDWLSIRGIIPTEPTFKKDHFFNKKRTNLGKKTFMILEGEFSPKFNKSSSFLAEECKTNDSEELLEPEFLSPVIKSSLMRRRKMNPEQGLSIWKPEGKQSYSASPVCGHEKKLTLDTNRQKSF